MLRTPQPKEQARLLAALLGEQGCVLQHQKALDIVARLHGHRNWHVLQAASAVEPDHSETPPQVNAKVLQQLLEAADRVVCNADDAGCSDDLTVTSQNAVQRLGEALGLIRTGTQPAAEAFNVAGFNVEDVLSVRPDLTDDEAMQVLEFCDRYYDASVGMNWDRLQDYSFQCLGGPLAVDGVLVTPDGSQRMVTVLLYSGRLLAGGVEGTRRLWDEERIKQAPRTYRWLNEQQPAGTVLRLPCGVDVSMSLETAVHGGSDADLQSLCDELRQAGVPFEQLPR